MDEKVLKALKENPAFFLEDPKGVSATAYALSIYFKRGKIEEATKLIHDVGFPEIFGNPGSELEGHNLLTLAIQSGNVNAVNWVLDNFENLVDEMIEAGPFNGHTALTYAATLADNNPTNLKYVEITEALMDKAPQILDKETTSGSTAFNIANDSNNPLLKISVRREAAIS